MSGASAVKGLYLAGLSVLLASYAQLAQKWGVTQLPSVTQWLSFNGHHLTQPISYWALVSVCSGLVAYLASMICWLGALHYLPLNRAYPLLGISYGLVYLGSVAIPWFEEAISFRGIFGVVFIIAGIVLINIRRRAAGRNARFIDKST